jgi:hypothetical protein
MYSFAQQTRKCKLIYTRKKSTVFNMSIFIQLTNAEQHYKHMTHPEFYLNQTRNAECKERLSIQVWLSMCQPSRNSESLNKYLWTCALSNFIQLGRNTQHIRANVSLRPQSMEFNTPIFTKLKHAFRKLRGDILYRTSPKSAKTYLKCGYSFPNVRHDYHLGNFNETHA